jgi:NAD(P)-dependent dehydrogenase (short-subunit alcohol dehydrogenase family)
MSREQNTMASKVAFITGASRGIGKAISLDLARHGFDIVATARSLEESVVSWGGTLQETASEVRDLGRRALPVKLDLTIQHDVRAAVDVAVEEFGRIDVLVTNATNIDFSPEGTYLNEFVATSWEALERHITVNIVSNMLLLRLILPLMYEQGSGIVMNVTQDAAWLSMSGLPMPGKGMCGMAIPVTRGVTERLAPALRREVEPHGVSILTFDPGMTLSNDSARYDDTMKAGYVPEMAHSVLVPARAATYVATCHNPSVYNGGTVVALDLVRSFGLLTEAEIFPDWRQGVQDVRTIPPLPGPAPG